MSGYNVKQPGSSRRESLEKYMLKNESEQFNGWKKIVVEQFFKQKKEEADDEDK